MDVFHHYVSDMSHYIVDFQQVTVPCIPVGVDTAIYNCVELGSQPI